VTERRPTNSELKLQRLEEEELEAAEQEHGILEIFPPAAEGGGALAGRRRLGRRRVQPRDEDEALARDPDEDR
jgi:hypothetical protein